MAGEGEHTNGTLALRLITDHIKDCTIARQNTADAIGDVKKLLVGFIAAVFTTVVVFAGYSYVQQQSLAHQLQQAQIQQAAAVAAIPDRTVRQLAVQPKPPAE